MAQGSLVDQQIYEGRRFLERFAADGNPVRAACWVKTEDGAWYLYVASDLYDQGDAYGAVESSIRKIPDCAIYGSDIKMISPSNPIAKDVMARMARHPAGLAIGHARLGSLDVEEAIIYPARLFTFAQANPMTSEELSREIVRLMNRGAGILQPSRVSLKDGTAFSGVPFSLELGPHRSVVASFIADGEAAPRVVPLDEIASIG